MRSTGTNIEQLGSGELYDPRSGTTYTLRYQGTTTAILAQKATLQALGYRVRYTPNEQGYDMLEAERSGADDADPNEPLSSLWYPKYNLLDKSVWDHPKVRAIFAKTPDLDARTAWKAMVQGWLLGDRTSQHSTETGQAISYAYLRSIAVDRWGATAADVEALLEGLTKGLEICPYCQQVLIHLYTIAKNATLRPSIANIGGVYTTDGLIAAEAIPTSQLNFDIATGYWHKSAPEMDPSRADRWTITQTFEYVAETEDQLDPLVHPLVVDA